MRTRQGLVAAALVALGLCAGQAALAADTAPSLAPESAQRPATRPLPEPPGRPRARVAAEQETPLDPEAEGAAEPAPAVEDLRNDPPGEMRLAETTAVNRGRPLRITVGSLVPPLSALGALADPVAARRMTIEGRLDNFFAPVGDGPALSEPLAALNRLPGQHGRVEAPPREAEGPEPPGRPRARTEAFENWASAWQARVVIIAQASEEQLADLSAHAVATAERPNGRRSDFARVVAAAAPRANTPTAGGESGPTGGGTPRALSNGSGLCGVAILSGSVLGNIDGPGQCGVQGAVEVTAIGGIRLSQGVTMDCTTATALANWVSRVANPAVGASGGGLARLEVAGGYTCRGRNGQAGARLSEHAFGHAVDIMGVRLQDGTNLSVLRNWGNAILRQMHRGACGIFGTVLGPDANAYHRDHFHFDTARYRNGSYCR